MADLILTSKLGTFTFDKRTFLSHAKLIRDSITAQFFSRKPDGPAIRTEEDAHLYVHQLGREIETIPFDLDIHPEARNLRMQAELAQERERRHNG